MSSLALIDSVVITCEEGKSHLVHSFWKLLLNLPQTLHLQQHMELGLWNVWCCLEIGRLQQVQVSRCVFQPGSGSHFLGCHIPQWRETGQDCRCQKMWAALGGKMRISVKWLQLPFDTFANCYPSLTNILNRCLQLHSVGKWHFLRQDDKAKNCMECVGCRQGLWVLDVQENLLVNFFSNVH